MPEREYAVKDARRAFAEHVRKNGVELEVAGRQAILAPVLLGRGHINKLRLITAQIPKLPDIERGYEACSDQVAFEKFGNPRCVLFVGLFAFDGFDILRVRKANITGFLKDIKNWNPILPGRF